MDLTLSYEQEEFRASTRRLADAAPLLQEGFDAAGYGAAWTLFAETGLAGLCLDPSLGGFSGQPEDIALIAAELGRAPGATPRIDSIVLAATLLAAGSHEASARARGQMAAGTLQPAVGWYEGGDAHGRDEPLTRARPSQGGFALNGRKLAVIGAETAGCLIISALLPAGDLALLMVDPTASGVEMHGYRLFDTTPVADIVFHDAPVGESGLIVQGEQARKVLAEALDHALVMQCAAALGGMDRAIELSIDYLKTRQQFGKPLADFQVLQHRVADMFIASNDARSSVYAAVAALREDASLRSRAASGCKVKVSATARSVIGDALHLHGGIGTTTEYPVGPLYRRAIVDSLLLGDADYHLTTLEVDVVGEGGDREQAALHDAQCASIA